jgi:hypothetical protein
MKNLLARKHKNTKKMHTKFLVGFCALVFSWQKKLLPIFFILFSLGALSAQNINFKDTTGLKNLLCSHKWIRYNINADSSFSNNISDSIVFYSNGTFYKSAEHKIDIVPAYIHDPIFTGKWHFGSTGKILHGDTITNCINIGMKILRKQDTGTRYLILIDGHKLKGTKLEKMCGNIDGPFIAWWDSEYGFEFNRYEIWQPARQKKN